MKTIFTLSLLPIIALAYFFSAQFYVAAELCSGLCADHRFLASVVYFVYQAGSRLEKSRTRIA